ncbi:MAG: DUF1302 family protein [Candidatus Binatia bacterium]
MREARCGSVLRWHATVIAALLAVLMIAALGAPARAITKYGDLEISGNVETQNLVRHPEIYKYQFVQNRNTMRLRVDWDWLKKGRWVDKFDIPFIERSKLYILYRGGYDGFYDIAPTDLQVGQERLDDIVGGPINGNEMGTLGPDGKLKQGGYSRLNSAARSDLKWENTLREAYIDLKLRDAPLSFRLGRQQVIWGESDQFRLMDIWNPLDTTWHVQQESWDNIRIPLWLGKGLWDIGQLGPLSNTFVEAVYNPGDFQPNAKLDFLPRPWAVPFPNPIRNGQVQKVGPGYYSTLFNMQGTSLRRGDYKRNPLDASEAGARFHAVTPQGFEFSINYLFARTRQVGANNPIGVKIDRVDLTPYKGTQDQNAPTNAGQFAFLDDLGHPVRVGTALVTAKTEFPYQHIFGFTANYFEGDYTSSVLRLETVFATDQPYQTVDPKKLPPAFVGASQSLATQGYDVRNTWAGMIGFDRPTWIRLLNDKATWFITGQFFWSYLPGNVTYLRGNSGASQTPYFTPASGKGSKSQGLGTWVTGPYAGITERVQAGACTPEVPCLATGTPDPSGDIIHRWEHLVTLAATSFYRSGTLVPFIADAWDPVNDNNEVAWNLDYYYTNNFIIQFQQKFYMTYGSRAPSNDPWFVGGRLGRRDETGIKLTYQF